MTRRFALRYSRWMLPLLWVVGLGPRHAVVQLSDTQLVVQMGWAFHANIPRRSIVQTRRPRAIWYAGGVHTTFGGRWIVAGSPSGIVALDLAPPVAGRTLGIPIRLKRLDISLVDPDGFLTALGT
jgi:hypothetical protein